MLSRASSFVSVCLCFISQCIRKEYLMIFNLIISVLDFPSTKPPLNSKGRTRVGNLHVMICIQLLLCRAVVEICIVNERLHIFNNFLVIWDKVALDESDIVHRLTQNTRNTVLPDTEYFEILSRNCRAVAECKTVFSNILAI